MTEALAASRETLSLAEIEALAFAALAANGASEAAGRSLARAVAAAEADGIASHGLAYVPTYCEHLTHGKVVGTAVPTLSRPAPAALVVDAACGFAHPAIELGFAELATLAARLGIAALGIRNSYNCGVLGFHTERLAASGLLALGFTHAPASMAPAGGRRRLVGTNPFAIAVPGRDGVPILSIDQSASVVAKSEVMKHQRKGRPIPPHWAFDAEGQPTEDATEALKGSMAPSGGYKGVGIALLVELLASALTGAVSSRKASPFSGIVGGPPPHRSVLHRHRPRGDLRWCLRRQLRGAGRRPLGTITTPTSPARAGRRRELRPGGDGVSVPAALITRIRSLAT